MMKECWCGWIRVNPDSLRRFEERVDFRLFTQERRAIKVLVERYPERYENESHFYRVAAVKLLREELEKQIEEVCS